MNTPKTSPLFVVRFFQVLSILVALTMVFAQAGNVAAQSGVAPSVTSYDQLPVQGQMIILANQGWVAPDEWNGLNVTLWYGVKTDTVATMSNLGNGISEDRANNYGGKSDDYPTVVWAGTVVSLSGGNNCRPEFYSDSAILTAGVVYGDECPILIEYNSAGHYIAQSAVPTLVPTNTPLPTVTLEPTATMAPVEPTEVVSAPTPIPQIAPVSPDMPVQVYMDPGLVGFIQFLGWTILICGIPLGVLALLVYGLVRLFRKPAEKKTEEETGES